MAKPFESWIQDLVYNVDVGGGYRFIRTALYIMVVCLVMLLYTAAQFRGFRDAEAMDYAQLARQFAKRQRLTTYCVRPASIWYLRQHMRGRNVPIIGHPDIVHAPLWPVLLGTVFKVARVQFPAEPRPGVFAPERFVIVPISHTFTLLTGLLLFLLAKRMFNRTVALVSVTTYFLSHAVWRESISGLPTPLLTFLATGAFYSAFVAVSNRLEGKEGKWWWPLVVSIVLCWLALMTRYAAVVLTLGVALYVGVALRHQRGWVWALVIVLAVFAGFVPWMIRNYRVSGGLLGLAPYTALNETRLFGGQAFERSLNPQVQWSRVLQELQAQFVKGLGKLYDEKLRTLGDGLLVCFFFVGFFYRFVRDAVHWFRWGVLAAIVGLIAIAALYGDGTARLLHMFWPLALAIGFGFLYVLIDRLALPYRLFEVALVGLIVFLTALPLGIAMLPPRATIPYPPYYPPFAMLVSNMLEPTEVLCTDMPWATAWYGDRVSVLLPATLDEFYEINDYYRRISGLYFTTLTRDKPYVRTLLTGNEKTWFPILEGRIPPDFPLTQGFPLNNLDQLFLTDRVRWKR